MGLGTNPTMGHPCHFPNMGLQAKNFLFNLSSLVCKSGLILEPDSCKASTPGPGTRECSGHQRDTNSFNPSTKRIAILQRNSSDLVFESLQSLVLLYFCLINFFFFFLTSKSGLEQHFPNVSIRIPWRAYENAELAGPHRRVSDSAGVGWG